MDLVTVSMGVYWFDLETFYSQVKRVLYKPASVIDVQNYGTNHNINSVVDAMYRDYIEMAKRYSWNPRVQYVLEGYGTLPFPFKMVLENGKGGEVSPIEMIMKREVSLDKYFGWFKSSSVLTSAR